MACNWKLDLLDLIEQDSNLKNVVNDFYGTPDMNFTGSGRPFFLMAKRNRNEIENFINKVHDLGLKFTWLWNGECLGYYKFNSQEQTKALNELDWIDDMEIEYLTVTDPYLAQFAKYYHPNLKLKTSVIAEINSLTRALQWQDIIGSEGVLTLSIMLNRNFPLLEEIRDTITCDIELLTNDCCLNECPYRFFHYNECSHASQTHDFLEGYYNDWASIACQNQKCFNPEQVIMCKWIQPLDLEKYINMGIDYFKISGRRYGTRWIFNALKAYTSKNFKGNLGEIFNGYSFVSDPLILAGNQFSEFSIKQEKMGTHADNQSIMLSVPEFDAKLKADLLIDFVQNLPYGGARCAENCGVSCFYCHSYVNKAYFQPEGGITESYKKFMSYLYNYLNKGEMFLSKEQRKLKNPVKESESNTYIGIPWDPKAQEFLDEVMILIPKEMQEPAKKGIGFTAERTAEKQNKTKVNIELLIAIILELVPQPFKRDYIEFLIEKKIKLSNYMSEAEIRQIKNIPFSNQLIPLKNNEGEIKTNINKIKEKQNKKKVKIKLNTKEEWEAYLTRFMKAYNELPDVEQMLEPIGSVVFQYEITDKPEMSYWQYINGKKMDWGMGKFSNGDIPMVIHKTNFETIKKVNSGESDPIQATMAGNYVVEGDVTKLMACAPLLPLNAKAHEQVFKN
ncbi:MAG: hypothetical protein JW891_08875 [Candidatus Lokiarchaeota archaeon]|nr:hypothetical protein [Candidatus Lokiarchaeota archaeon]